jgi:hypothetical protein
MCYIRGRVSKYVTNVKHEIFERGKNIYFSTYPPSTLIHLSHCFISKSKPVAESSFDCCFSYFRTWSDIIWGFRTSAKKFLDTFANCFTRQTLPAVNRKRFFMNILCTEFFCLQKNAQQNAALRYYTSQARSLFWPPKPASKHEHARLLPRLSWSWTVLLPNDTHGKPITSITAVLLPFMTYLLTLLCILWLTLL